MENKPSGSYIIHGEEEGLPRGLPRITLVPLSCTLHTNAARVPRVPDRSCRSGAANHARLARGIAGWARNLVGRRNPLEEAVPMFLYACACHEEWVTRRR
jgi:hypothetical protein